MTKYESLMAEYDDRIIIEERPMSIDGLYCDGVIWIKKDLSSAEKYCILAEEIGHYETTVGNILLLDSIDNAKQELKARQWAYRKVIPLEALVEDIRSGLSLIDIADRQGVDANFLADALGYYRGCYGKL